MTREDAIYEIRQLAVLSTNKNIERITEALNMAIEALTMQYGEWVNSVGKPIKDNHSVYCSICGEWSEYRSDFCPNCGAEMTDRKTENSSEKPNNCEVKNYCDDCLYTDTCDSKEFFYACTSKATISKMEQVEKPQTCDTCKYGEDKHRYAHICNECGVGINNYEPKDEPQTDCPWK